MPPLFASLTLLLMAACGAPREPSARNVVVVLVDTLRADHMSTYGYPRETTPRIDLFVEQAVVFEDNRSQATCTYPSVPSLLSSRYPFEFVLATQGRVNVHVGPIPREAVIFPEDKPYLPRILQRAGYFTAAISSSPIIRKTPSRYNKTGGFDPGFEKFVELPAWSPAAAVNRSLEREVLADLLASRDAGRPFFLYLHYTDPHDPYAAPTRRFAGDYTGRYPFIAAGEVNPLGGFAALRAALTRNDLEQLVARYDDEIHYFDTQFGALIDLLGAEGLLDDTMVIIVSDHGEEILDHGYVKHCHAPPFDAVVRTPLIVSVPGFGATGRREQLTTNLDVVPTILDYLGIDSAPFELHGRGLRGSIERGGRSARWAFGSQFAYRFVTDGRSKLIFRVTDGSTWLFDLAADADETSPVDDPDVADALMARMAEWRSEIEGGIAEKEVLDAERELEESLRAVGYIQ